MLAIRPLLSFLRRSFNVAGTCKGTRLNAVNALLGYVCVSLRGSILFPYEISSCAVVHDDISYGNTYYTGTYLPNGNAYELPHSRDTPREGLNYSTESESDGRGAWSEAIYGDGA